jgi:hypothetical protein
VDPFADLDRRFAALDERLRPIANRPVDIGDPGWLDRLRALPSPLDRAGIRPDAETLVREVSERYRTGTGAERALEAAELSSDEDIGMGTSVYRLLVRPR